MALAHPNYSDLLVLTLLLMHQVLVQTFKIIRPSIQASRVSPSPKKIFKEKTSEAKIVASSNNQPTDQNETGVTPTAMNDQDFYDAAWEEYTVNRTGPFTFGMSSRIVFESLKDLDPDFETLAGSLSSFDHLDHLPPIYKKSEVLSEGYKLQLEALQKQFRDPSAAVVEIAFGGGGAVTVALQKPLSRGTIMINSTDPDPSRPPLLNFNAGANPVDIKIAILAIRKVRDFMSAESLSSLQPVELVPGADIQTDEELEATMRASLYFPSFAHPVGTAAMMPRELGGVVDTDLRVYGTEGLLVVDASIMPILPAGHTQATVYAVAEAAADIIKQVADV